MSRRLAVGALRAVRAPTRSSPPPAPSPAPPNPARAGSAAPTSSIRGRPRALGGRRGAGSARGALLGALVPWKRADLALEIAARSPGLRLDVAGAPLPGDPPAFAAALARARRATRPARPRAPLGAVAEPRAALAEAHVLLHCADAEPFGLALVEALAAGRPVVAPAAGGPLEIVTPAVGRLYAAGDPDAGAAAVFAVLAAPPPPETTRARAAAFDRAEAAARFAAVVARHLD